jgi:hypothetical protein
MTISFVVTSPPELADNPQPLHASNISAWCICSKATAKPPVQVEFHGTLGQGSLWALIPVLIMQRQNGNSMIVMAYPSG